MMSELITSIPGIDEAMNFAEMLRTIMELEFEVIVFDTAPTGHTLRLLNFPDVLERGLQKLVSMKGFFDLIVTSMNSSPEEMYGTLFEKINEMKTMVEGVNAQFKNPALTTFVAVCIPEFLSLFETERLVQELFKNRIDIGHIVVNQVLFPDSD
jgi:arsenite-transporting ATPase